MPNTTNFNWTTPADTDLVKDGAAAIRTLAGNIDTSLVDLKGGTTGQYLSKNSNTDLDFTWGTPSSGGLTLISEQTASASNSITFSSISGSYKQLILIWSGLYASNTTTEFAVRLNNTSTSSYHTPLVGFYGSGTPTFYWNQGGPIDYAVGFQTYGVSSSGLTVSSKGRLVIDNYASTTKLKTFTWHQFSKRDGGQFQAQQEISGVFDSTSAITSVDIYRHEGAGTLSNATNTSIRLYGLS